jgi:DNA-binding transcriptional regulator YiaG
VSVRKQPPPDEALRAILARMKLTQVAAAALLRVKPRTMRAWCGGHNRIPEWAFAFLDVVETVPGARERVLWHAGK